MEEQKKEFIKWVKKYKNQLILAGISITVLIGIVLKYQKKREFIQLESELQELIKENLDKKLSACDNQMPKVLVNEVQDSRITNLVQDTIEVSQHIRNLPEGRHHSARKMDEAVELGIILLPNQTLVDAYVKKNVA